MGKKERARAHAGARVVRRARTRASPEKRGARTDRGVLLCHENPPSRSDAREASSLTGATGERLAQRPSAAVEEGGVGALRSNIFMM